MKTLLLAATALLALAGTAHAQRFSKLTGSTLAGLCTNKDPKQVEGCEAFINGVSDTASFYQRLRPADSSKGAPLPEYLCVPASATGIQLRESVVAWIGGHKDQAPREASGIVLRALHDAFPCTAPAKP
jgi:hypothetical protein